MRRLPCRPGTADWASPSRVREPTNKYSSSTCHRSPSCLRTPISPIKRIRGRQLIRRSRLICFRSRLICFPVRNRSRPERRGLRQATLHRLPPRTSIMRTSSLLHRSAGGLRVAGYRLGRARGNWRASRSRRSWATAARFSAARKPINKSRTKRPRNRNRYNIQMRQRLCNHCVLTTSLRARPKSRKRSGVKRRNFCSRQFIKSCVNISMNCGKLITLRSVHFLTIPSLPSWTCTGRRRISCRMPPILSRRNRARTRRTCNRPISLTGEQPSPRKTARKMLEGLYGMLYIL